MWVNCFDGPQLHMCPKSPCYTGTDPLWSTFPTLVCRPVASTACASCQPSSLPAVVSIDSSTAKPSGLTGLAFGGTALRSTKHTCTTRDTVGDVPAGISHSVVAWRMQPRLRNGLVQIIKAPALSKLRDQWATLPSAMPLVQPESRTDTYDFAPHSPRPTCHKKVFAT